MKKIILILLGIVFVFHEVKSQSWVADNGNGTFTNPLFYEDFSDPDIIRVGNDYYMVGSTMHVMPGLPVLHSKDLVNWQLLTYAFDTLDLGPEFHLEGNHGAYGNGIWAPAIRYHNGMFYIFVNVNGYGLQVYTSTNPAGPWAHRNMGGIIYDLGVLFDGDKIYAVYGYDEVHLIEIKSDLSGYVEGSDKVIIPKGNAMGEGHHFYKIKGKYYIISADYAPVGRMQCARADNIDGPYQTVVISDRETMGTQRGWTTQNFGFWSANPVPGDTIKLSDPGNGNYFAAYTLHQGGIVDLPNGDWWGFSMADAKALGRMTFLSPVTWKDGWPYFGLPGNLGRSPRTWLKPNTGVNVKPVSVFKRSDDFASSKLQPVWQWNHIPVNAKWSLAEKKGVLRLHTLPASDFFKAKNTLTQHVVGPVSEATVTLDATGMKEGDIAGLGLLSVPYYWIGIIVRNNKYFLRSYNEVTNTTLEEPLNFPKIALRVYGNYESDTANFSYSENFKTFQAIGGKLQLAYQMKTFQGVRYSLFAFNTEGREGGYADFDDFIMKEPLANRSQNTPLGKIITLRNFSNNLLAYASPHGLLHFAYSGSPEAKSSGVKFNVLDRGLGRVVLEAQNGMGFLTVAGEGLSGDVRLVKKESEDCLFQWQDMLHNQCMLMSLKTHRYLGLDPETGEPYSADWPGAAPNRKNGIVLVWNVEGY
ncbi:Beta-xylosidase [Arachidicoccus rhizosphaerae]|uniref:Beta-xylosidase n=1 Tax=Arachidicoccus rhizosphaerae TaxID=551991 RepID=A0A1H3VG43_9BACT|nr:glycoside hydrolase 43 family protein [Arachidicoccus rhizosphaerae]SDZ73112.1 Beta-xylosidase [Arachidicoccus rhizosphaerae]